MGNCVCMFLFKMWFLFVLLFSPVTSNAFKSRSNHELTVLKKLIQTWIIFFLKGQKMLVLKIHYFIDGIHWSAYALGPIGKDTNLVHSPALPPSLCISAVLLHDKALLKKKKSPSRGEGIHLSRLNCTVSFYILQL